MSKFHFPAHEVNRAAATALLTIGVAAAFFGVMDLTGPPGLSSGERVDQAARHIPDRPAGGRRWRSSNAEQSLKLLTYFGDTDPWVRHRTSLEGAMSLFEMGSTFSSAEIAGGTLRVTLTKDYLTAYLETPYLGADASLSVATGEDASGRPFVIGAVLARAFAAEQLAQK